MALRSVNKEKKDEINYFELEKRLTSLAKRYPDMRVNLSEQNCDFFYRLDDDNYERRFDAKIMFLEKAYGERYDVKFTDGEESSRAHSLGHLKSLESADFAARKLHEDFVEEIRRYVVKIMDRFDGKIVSSTAKNALIVSTGNFAGANGYTLNELKEVFNFPATDAPYISLKGSNDVLENAFADGVVLGEKRKISDQVQDTKPKQKFGITHSM